MSTTALLRVSALLVLGSSCAGPLASVTQARQLSPAVRLEWAPEDEAEQRRVGLAIERVAPALLRWGGLPAAVTVLLAPSHDALVSAVHRRGFDWLHAWARWDEVIVQSPRTWSPSGAADAEVDELLLHELTHCLLFQRASPKADFARVRVPLWFREGMATATANQGYHFPTLEELSRWLAAHPALDPFADGEALSRDYFPYVYATAHHAFTYLLRRTSDAAVIRMLAALGEGRSFEDAFQAGAGLSAAALAQDFARYLRGGDFRGPLPGRAQGPPTP